MFISMPGWTIWSARCQGAAQGPFFGRHARPVRDRVIDRQRRDGVESHAQPDIFRVHVADCGCPVEDTPPARSPWQAG